MKKKYAKKCRHWVLETKIRDVFIMANNYLSALAATRDASLSWKTCSHTATKRSSSKQPGQHNITHESY